MNTRLRHRLVWLLAIVAWVFAACNQQHAPIFQPDDSAPQLEAPGPPTKSGPIQTVPLRPLVGPLRVVGGIVQDATGPRLILGYSDFPALRIWEDNQPEELSTLAAAARAGYQYVRIAYTLAENETDYGGYWRGAHVSPELAKRTLVPFIKAAAAHGIRVHLFGAYNWCKSVPASACKGAELDFIRWMAGAIRDAGLGPSVALFEWRNEWTITSPWGVSPDSYAVAREAMQIMRDALGCLVTMGSPGEDDPEIRKTVSLTVSGALASIDGLRGLSGPLYMKHANGFFYRGRYQGGYAGAALWVTEPTGPNGVDGDVYSSLEDKAFLLGYYGTSAVSAQVLTTFSGASVRHRRPIDSIWGFYEMPRLLRFIPDEAMAWRGPTWFTDGTRFVAVLAEEWGLEKRPERPIKSWEMLTTNGLAIGGVGPAITVAPGWKAAIFRGEWQ